MKKKKAERKDKKDELNDKEQLPEISEEEFKTFIQSCLDGENDPSDIHDFVLDYNRGRDSGTVHDRIGISSTEWDRFEDDPEGLEMLVTRRIERLLDRFEEDERRNDNDKEK